MFLLFVCALALGAQINPQQPGRNRADAPAQHEIARENLPDLGDCERLMTPRDRDPTPPLDPRISQTVRLTEDTRADDSPDIATKPADRNQIWAVWASFNGVRDQNRLAAFNQAKNAWAAWITLPGVSGDVWRPKLAFDSANRLWIIWSQQDRGNFDLYARWYDGKAFGPRQRLTSAPQADFDHAVARGPRSSIWVAWAGFRDGQSDIFLIGYDASRWSAETRVSDSDRNDWEPAVAVDSKGVVHVA